jgi:hypothetical protein
MIEKINTSQIQDILGQLSGKQPDVPKTPVDKSKDASLQVDYAALISKATQIPETDAETIKKAEELLRSGQLESLENIREAANNILKFGV